MHSHDVADILESDNISDATETQFKKTNIQKSNNNKKFETVVEY